MNTPLEDLLIQMRPYLITEHYNHYFLNIMASVDRDYWSASYANVYGESLRNFIATGKTPLEALQKLKEKTELLDLLEKPVAPGESAQSTSDQSTKEVR